MGAYAALLSLSHTLDHIFFHDQYPLLLHEDNLVSLYQNVSFLLAFLEHYSSKNRGVLHPLESRIIDAAYQAEDFIDSQLLPQQKNSALEKMMDWFQSSNSKMEQREFHKELQEKKTGVFHKALQEIKFISKQVVRHQAEDIPPPPNFSDSASSSTIAPGDQMKTTVGLDDDFMAIKDQMYQMSPTFHVIPIHGMGGIGKTTLASRLYEDSINMQWFDRRIWIVVSQDYSLRTMILGILQSIKMPIDEKCTDGQLVQIVYQELFGRRYLIVADDVWSEEAWDILNRVLPKDTIGSQVLVTTRLQSVATYVGSSSSSQREIHLLSEEQSWRLLEDRVFANESCPIQLEQIGMEIAKCCHGLPLMIVVLAGLLKEDITEAYWKTTLLTISSSARSDIVEHCSKVLSLSYDHLPLYLKPCFLFVTAFPEDYEIEADELVRLWMAEGFVKENVSKCLEKVGEGYLNDLVSRSLLIGSKNRYGDKIRAVKIHDSLRDVGILKAREGRFYHDCVPWNSKKDKERRVTTHNFKPQDFSKCQDSTLRTYLNTGNYSYLRTYRNRAFQSNRFLKVLYSPHEEVEIHLIKRMVLLKYVVIRCDHPPKFLSKLQNLQTLDIDPLYYDKPIHMPLKIWKMPFLREVKIPHYFYLDQPSKRDIVKETNLQTFTKARNLKITQHAVKMLANLRKLYLYYEDVGFFNRRNIRLKNLIHLEKLEELGITSFGTLEWKNIFYPELKLPMTLKKLELHCVYVPWECINRVGLLPKLEDFRIDHGAGAGSSQWNLVEGGFLELKYLELNHVYLKDWVVESIHFRSLEILVLKEMDYLEEIPSGIGEIDALKVIELHDCKQSLVDSAYQIQTDEQEMGNEGIQVLVHESVKFTQRKNDNSST